MLVENQFQMMVKKPLSKAGRKPNINKLTSRSASNLDTPKVNIKQNSNKINNENDTNTNINIKPKRGPGRPPRKSYFTEPKNINNDQNTNLPNGQIEKMEDNNNEQNTNLPNGQIEKMEEIFSGATCTPCNEQNTNLPKEQIEKMEDKNNNMNDFFDYKRRRLKIRKTRIK